MALRCPPPLPLPPLPLPLPTTAEELALRSSQPPGPTMAGEGGTVGMDSLGDILALFALGEEDWWLACSVGAALLSLLSGGGGGGGGGSSPAMTLLSCEGRHLLLS